MLWPLSVQKARGETCRRGRVGAASLALVSLYHYYVIDLRYYDV